MDQKKNNKKPNGRRKLNPDLKRERVYIYLNKNEIRELSTKVQDSVFDNSSAYIRSLILEENNRPRHINPVSFLKDISKLALEVNKVGVNINQLTKHANEMAIQNIIHPELAQAIEEKITTYALQQRQIIAKLREVIKSK